MYRGSEPMALPPVNRPPTLECRAERDTVRVGESVRLFATVDDPDGDMVTVTWSASAGTVTPATGTEVTWSTEGVDPGSGPISARATDGYGGTADCSLRLTVEAPPPPPEPTVMKFSIDEFGSGSARVDNRHKAILDDVALQMRQNPGATAVLTGYSDNTGSLTRNQELALERAENVKAYLVDVHGIDPSRITVISGGVENPVGDNATREGRAANRRVEIVVTIPPQ
jgi:OOP family OmpA-OmpF porin